MKKQFKKEKIKTILGIVTGLLTWTSIFILACIKSGIYVIG